MGLGYSGDDVVIKFALDMDDLKSDLKKLQSAVEKSFENMEKQAKENADQMEDKFDDAFEKMEREAKGSVNSINNKLSSISKGTKSLVGAFGKVGGAITAAFSVHAIAGFGKSIVEAAADLEAMEAAFEQVFVTKTGDYTGQATKNLEKMCKEWDMELNTLKGDYSAFAAQFKGLGMDMADSMKYSDTSLRLAADAAAMFNIPMQEAIDHVRSFVKGNYIGGESIQLFGSQAMLASYAVEQGLIKEEKAFKELTEAQKQMIRLDFAKHQYDLAGTTGQAAREADMYANQLTKLKQKWTDFKAALGEKAMEGVVGIFKDLSSALESIDTEKIGDFFGDLLRMLGEGFGAGLELFVGWINSVNWEWFGIQLEEIRDLLKDFGGGAIEGISEVLSPVADTFIQLWDSITGVDDINTENMDSTNLALVRIKPIFEWLADNGESVGKGIGHIVEALAAWKVMTLEFKIGNLFADIIKEGGFVAWLGKKMNLTDVFAGAGITSTGGLLTVALEAGIIIAIGSILWKWQSKNHPEYDKNTKKRINSLTGKGDGGVGINLNDGKNYNWEKGAKNNKGNPVMGGDTYDWAGLKEELDKWLGELSLSFSTWGDDIAENLEQLKLEWNAFWLGIWNSKFVTGLREFLGGLGDSWSTWGDDISENLDQLELEWDNFWLGIWNSKFVTGLRTFLGGLGDSWATWGDDIAENLDQLETEWNNFWLGIWNSKFVTGLRTFLGGLKGSWSTWGSDIKKNIRSLKDEWSKFWEDIKNSKFANGLKTFFNKVIRVLNSGITNFLTGLNVILRGINWVYKKISGKDKNLIGLIQIDKHKINEIALAKGTDNWRGGTALVGEAGRELVSDPKLGTFMADRPMILPLSKGAAVLRNSKTERLLKSMGINAYAKGKDESIFDSLLDSFGTLWSFMSEPKKLWEKVLEKIGLDFGDNVIVKGLESGVKKIFSADLLKDKIAKWFKDSIPDVGNLGKNVDQWKPYVIKAAAYFGEKLTDYEMKQVMQQIKNESGGDQTVRQSAAVDDENARSGNWARGLLQYVPSTFNTYKVPGFGNIHNGYHQLLAFFNNSTWRKALPKLGVKRGWSPRGNPRFANGGLVDSPTYGLFGEAGTEALVPLSNARALKPFGQSVVNAIKEDNNISTGGGVYEFTIPVIIDGRQVAVATATYTKEELDKLEKRQDRRYGKR